MNEFSWRSYLHEYEWIDILPLRVFKWAVCMFSTSLRVFPVFSSWLNNKPVKIWRRDLLFSFFNVTISGLNLGEGMCSHVCVSWLFPFKRYSDHKAFLSNLQTLIDSNCATKGSVHPNGFFSSNHTDSLGLHFSRCWLKGQRFLPLPAEQWRWA